MQQVGCIPNAAQILWIFFKYRAKIVESPRTDPFSVPGSGQYFGDGRSHNEKYSWLCVHTFDGEWLDLMQPIPR